MEKRILSTHEIRANKTGDKMTVSGYAARYNTLSNDLGGFKERIAPGAFDRILASKPDVVALFNHDMNSVLGRTTSGTLRLNADNVGLAFELDLPNTTVGRDTYESVKRGDLNGCSFAFALGERMDSFAEEEFDEEDGEGLFRAIGRKVKQIVRTIRDFAGLYDISVVTNPAYPGTCVDARYTLVAAEVRSRVAEFGPNTPEHSQEVRKRFAERAEEASELQARRRRDLLEQV
jgi:HK97 family phage prohead protease